MEIRNIFYEILNQNDVEWNESYNSLTFTEAGIDSMLFIQLIIEIEDTFGFEFEDEDLDLSLYSTMNDLINKTEYYYKNKVVY